MNLSFSFIIPVYNRPNEIKELLDSLRLQTYDQPFEVVIVEDGSTISSEEVIGEYVDYLSISYYKKANSGPGDSRNYGMAKAKGNYFIVLDSDCILPPQYLKEADKSLKDDFVHCYGGPDAAHESFSTVQKAINYAMTSFHRDTDLSPRFLVGLLKGQLRHHAFNQPLQVTDIDLWVGTEKHP